MVDMISYRIFAREENIAAPYRHAALKGGMSECPSELH